MNGMVRHKHQLIFTPRNELTESQAEIAEATLRETGRSVRVDKDHTSHIEISWEEVTHIWE